MKQQPANRTLQGPLPLPDPCQAEALERQVEGVLGSFSIGSAEAIQLREQLWEETTRAVGHVRKANETRALLRVLEHLYQANASLSALVRGLWRAGRRRDLPWQTVEPLGSSIRQLQHAIDHAVRSCKAEIARDPRHRDLQR